jgi:hypothetical protein
MSKCCTPPERYWPISLHRGQLSWHLPLSHGAPHGVPTPTIPKGKAVECLSTVQGFLLYPSLWAKITLSIIMFRFRGECTAEATDADLLVKDG